MAVRREAGVAVDDHQIEVTGRVGEESGEAGSGPAFDLVDVGGDVAPPGLASHLGSEPCDLALQPAATSVTGGFPGVDGDSPHGASFLVQRVRA